MPSPDTVLAGLTAIANEWRWLAITWHILLGGSVVLFLIGWRPSVRWCGYLLVAPLLSVSLTAWLAGNPFNASVFAILAGALAATAAHFPNAAVRRASPAFVATGLAFVAFGATYPHFVQAQSWLTYLYASSFGILPCPTLSILIGSTLTLSNLRSTSWSTPLSLAGLLYGVIGVFRLGVVLDLGLLLASGVLVVAVARDRGLIVRARGRLELQKQRKQRWESHGGASRRAGPHDGECQLEKRHVQRHIDLSDRSRTREPWLRDSAGHVCRELRSPPRVGRRL